MILKRPNDFILFALIAYMVAMSALIMIVAFNQAFPEGQLTLPKL